MLYESCSAVFLYGCAVDNEANASPPVGKPPVLLVEVGRGGESSLLACCARSLSGRRPLSAGSELAQEPMA
jgi:hypothetical protein